MFDLDPSMTATLRLAAVSQPLWPALVPFVSLFGFSDLAFRNLHIDQWWCLACSRACLERSLAVAARPKSPGSQTQKATFEEILFHCRILTPTQNRMTDWPTPSDYSQIMSHKMTTISSQFAWGVRKSEWRSALEFIVEKMGAENLRITQLRLGTATRLWLSTDSLGTSSWFGSGNVCFFVALRQTNVGC